MFRLALRLQVSIVIGKADYSVGIADIDILWAWSGRVKGNAIRLVQAAGKSLSLLRFSIAGNPAEYLDVTSMALSDEDITVGRGRDFARLIKAGGEQFDFESGWG